MQTASQRYSTSINQKSDMPFIIIIVITTIATKVNRQYMEFRDLNALHVITHDVRRSVCSLPEI